LVAITPVRNNVNIIIIYLFIFAAYFFVETVTHFDHSKVLE